MQRRLSHRLTSLFAVPLSALALCFSPIIRPAEANLLVPGANITLQSLINTQYVCADNAGRSPLIANRTAVGPWETFTEVDQGGNAIGLRAMANGKYVCADNTGSSPLIANRTSVGSFETFLVNAPPGLPSSQVYIGTMHGWDDLNNNPTEWSYVRANADGFYANFIQLLPTVGNPAAQCNATAALMTHKNAYFESDSRYTGLGGFPNGGQYTLATEAQEMDELLNAGFAITYSSLNYGVDSAKLSQCKTYRMPSGTTRPCLAQNGPWLFGGNINLNVDNNPSIRNDIANTDGESTDGPLDLWASNNGGMQTGSTTVVQYAHGIGKTAMVMVSPGQLPPAQWLATVQQCVRYQENAGAKPDIWADYAYDTATPTVPEMNADGSPANTVTGAAFWLIHHLIDPAHWARLILPDGGLSAHLCTVSHATILPAAVRAAKAFSGTTPLESTDVDVFVPVTRQANGHSSATRTVDLTLRNESAWLDLSPVLCADVNDPGRNWTVGFRLDGRDITEAVVRKGGFAFIKDQRLWPNANKHLQLVLTCNSPSAPNADSRPVTVRIGLLANPTRRDRLNETLTIHGTTVDKATLLASTAGTSHS